MAEQADVKRDRCPECGYPLDEEGKNLHCKNCGWSDSGQERDNSRKEFY